MAYTSTTARLFVEAGLPLRSTAIYLEPYLGLTGACIATPKFNERGGDAGLTARSQRDSQLHGELGLRVGSPAAPTVSWYGAATWRHRYGRAAATSDLNFVDGPAFTIASAATAVDSAMLELGVEARLWRDVAAHVSYRGQAAHAASEHTLQANLSWHF